MASFPELTPTSRQFSPGTYPQRTYRTLSGVLARRTFGDTAFGATLDLEYRNIPDTSVNLILDHYHSQTSQNARFKLSNNVTAGMSNDVRDEVRGYGGASADRKGLRWEYAEPPSVDSVRPGIYNVRVRLAGEIRNPALDDK